jgi:hypothetical protein
MVTSVAAAFFDAGSRKAGTPSEIASTPVSATAPEEKPLRSTNRLRLPPAWANCTAWSGSKGTGSMWPKRERPSPMRSIAESVAMYR